jgi:beta-glucosidase
VRYHARYLEAILRALDVGVPVEGYTFWSLLDSYEWCWETTGSRYGMIYVDPETQERTIKDSGRWYAQVAKANALVPVLTEEGAPNANS